MFRLHWCWATHLGAVMVPVYAESLDAELWQVDINRLAALPDLLQRKVFQCILCEWSACPRPSAPTHHTKHAHSRDASSPENFFEVEAFTRNRLSLQTEVFTPRGLRGGLHLHGKGTLQPRCVHKASFWTPVPSPPFNCLLAYRVFPHYMYITF